MTTKIDLLEAWPNKSIIAYVLFPLIVFWVINLYQSIAFGIFIATCFNGFLGATLIGFSHKITRRAWWPESADIYLNISYTFALACFFQRYCNSYYSIATIICLSFSFFAAASITEHLVKKALI